MKIKKKCGALLATITFGNVGALVPAVGKSDTGSYSPSSLRVPVAHDSATSRVLQDSTPPSINGEQFPGTKCLDDQFMELLRLQGVPGGSLSVMMHNGEVVYKQGYGTRDAPNVDTKTENRPFLPSTPSRIFSISKVLTAMTVVLLAQEGKLNLDDLVFAEGGLLHSYLVNHENNVGTIVTTRTSNVTTLPYVRGVFDPRLKDITIRHLMTHTAGFTVSLNGEEGFPFDMPVLEYEKIRATLGMQGVVSCPDIIQYMVGVPLMHDPGTVPEYSNFGYCVLQDIIERASGMSIQQATNKLLLEPLGVDTDQMYPMKTSRLEDAKPQEAEYFMQDELDCYRPSVYDPEEGDLPCAYGGLYNAISAIGYAGWVASSQELVKLGKLVDCDDSECLIQEPWRSEMLARPAAWPVDTPLWVGYAWWVVVDPNGESFTLYHEGGGSGGGAYFIHTSEYSLAFVMNGNNQNGITNYETGQSKLIEMMKCVDDEDWPGSSAYQDNDASAGGSSAATSLGFQLAVALLVGSTLVVVF